MRKHMLKQPRTMKAHGPQISVSSFIKQGWAYARFTTLCTGLRRITLYNF